jgi:copper chaperone
LFIDINNKDHELTYTHPGWGGVIINVGIQMLKLKVVGMTCGHCEMSVREALSSVAGVTKVVGVNRDLNEAIVEGTPDPKMLVDAVVNRGFEAEIVQ